MTPRSLTAAAAAGVLALTMIAVPAGAAARQPIQVGSVTLDPRPTSEEAWCTTIAVPSTTATLTGTTGAGAPLAATVPIP